MNVKFDPDSCLSACADLMGLVLEQADDEALWAHAETVAEVYVQERLRELHGAIEQAVENIAQGTMTASCRVCEAGGQPEPYAKPCFGCYSKRIPEEEA